MSIEPHFIRWKQPPRLTKRLREMKRDLIRVYVRCELLREGRGKKRDVRNAVNKMQTTTICLAKRSTGRQRFNSREKSCRLSNRAGSV